MTYNCIYPLWFFPLSWEGEQGFKKQRPAYLCQILPIANTAVPNCFIVRGIPVEHDFTFPFVCNGEAMFYTMRFEMERVLWFMDRSFCFSMVCWETGSVKWVWWACLVGQMDANEAVPCSCFLSLWGCFLPCQQNLCSTAQKGMLSILLLCWHCPLWNARCQTGSRERILVWKQGMSMWSVVFYTSPSLVGIRFSCPQKRSCRFVTHLLTLASWRSFGS